MPHYCTLIVRSDREGDAEALFRSDALHLLDVTDNLSPERLASAERFRSMGLVRRADLPRFTWCLDSRTGVASELFDLEAHVSWLLSQFKTSAALDQARARGAEALLSLYYGGNGTGGGPFVSSSLAEVLVRYEIDLQVGFYYEESDAV
jgi:hypothetical protein